MVDAHGDYSRLAGVAGGLGLHEHLCLIYDTQEEQLAAALPYLRTGLERGEKCLYFADENTAAAVLDNLRQTGTDIDQYLRSGALTVTQKRETDLQQGCFDTAWWVGFLNQASAEATAANFSAVRILGDMSWGLRGGKSTDKLVEYESRINHFVRDHDARVICQYKRNVNAPELILGIIRTHPVVVYGSLVCKNPYYVPPDEFLEPNQPALEVERLLNNIRESERTEKALRDSEEKFRALFQTVQVGVIVSGPNAEVLRANPAALHLLGVTKEQLLGTTSFDPKWQAFYEDGTPCPGEEHPIPRAISTRKPVRNVVLGVYRPVLQDLVWLLVSAQPQVTADGSVSQAICSFEDITERKRAEDELRRQKEILQKIFDNVPIMINFTGADGRIEMVNREWERTIGWTLNEIREQDVDIFAATYPDPEHRQEVLEFVAAAEGKFGDFRTRVRGGRVIDTSWVRVRLSDGTTIGIGRDITERKRAEEALRKSEERWRAVFESSAIGVALTDLNGQFLAANPVYQKMVGYTEEELRGLTFLDLTQEDYHEANWTLITELLEGKRQQFQIEKQYRRKDGSLIWVCNSVSLVPGTQSVPRFIMALSEEIEERKRGEGALRRSEAYLAAGQRLSHTGSWALNLSSGELYWSQETYRIFGFDPAKTSASVNGTFLPRIHPEDRPIIEEGFKAAAIQKEPYGIEYRIVLPDGSIKHIHDVVYPVISNAGDVVERYGLVMDVTERKRTEEALQRSRDQLRALAARAQTVREEERTRVAREIHDELGQSLTAIKIDLSSLSRERPEDKQQKLESILKLLDETIQSVRRISTELRPAVLDAVGLVAALEWAAEEFEARTGTKCRLELPAVDIVIDAEAATVLFRIFQETLTNVARHAGATGVHVRLMQENGILTLEVHDNGKGITEKQLSASDSLGILGMRERALLLGGELTIRGAPGEGTTVTVRIPQSHSTPPEYTK